MRKCLLFARLHFLLLFSLCEKCPYSGPHFTAFGLNTVFSPNAGKYGPENAEYGHFSSSV